jgi:glycosyltransferase involved in cell wall biosynthesis
MTAGERPLRVLMVSNHRMGRDRHQFAGIFVDRQIESLQRIGVLVDYFDVGTPNTVRDLWRAWRGLRAHVRQTSPDLVHAQYGALVGVLATLSGARAIVTFAGSDLHRGGGNLGFFRKILGRSMSNFAALRATRVICVSDELRRYLWFRRSAAVVIPRGVDLGHFSPGSKAEARATLGLPPDVPVVLFTGGRDPRNKGLALAEEAYQIARREIPELQFCNITAPTDAHGMLQHYRASDVLLFTSMYEGSPNTIKEALACNLPIVSVPVGDVEERLQGATASVVLPRDAQTLGRAVVDIIRNGRQSNGRSIVQAISLEAIADRIALLYRDTLSRYG